MTHSRLLDPDLPMTLQQVKHVNFQTQRRSSPYTAPPPPPPPHTPKKKGKKNNEKQQNKLQAFMQLIPGICQLDAFGLLLPSTPNYFHW